MFLSSCMCCFSYTLKAFLFARPPQNQISFKLPYSSFHVILEDQLLVTYTVWTVSIYSGWVFSCFLTSGTYISHIRKCPENAARRGQTLKAVPNMESYQLHKTFYFCLQHKTLAQRIMLKKGFQQNVLASYKNETNFLHPCLLVL